jgi:hypothetical protein
LRPFSFSFLFGASSNFSRFESVAGRINEALLEPSTIDYINLNAGFMDGDYDYPSLQAAITKKSNDGWPNHCFRELPIYNLENDLGVSYKLDSINGNNPIFIANSNWGVHQDQNGTTMDSLYLTLLSSSANATANGASNFCYISQSLADKLKNERKLEKISDLIDTPIVLSFQGSDYQLNISNIILNLNDISSNVSDLFGGDFFLINQSRSAVPFYSSLRVCLFLSQPISSLTIASFISQLHNDRVEYNLQENYYTGKRIISSKTQILTLLDQSYYNSIPESVSLLVASLFCFCVPFFVFRKKSFSKIQHTLFVCSAVLSFLLFLAMSRILQNLRYFSSAGMFLFLIFIIAYLSIAFAKRKVPSSLAQPNSRGGPRQTKDGKTNS